MGKRDLDEIEKMDRLPRDVAEDLRREANAIAEHVAGNSHRLNRILRLLKKEVER